MNTIELGTQLMLKTLLVSMVLVEPMLKLVLKFIKLVKSPISKTFTNYKANRKTKFKELTKQTKR